MESGDEKEIDNNSGRSRSSRESHIDSQGDKGLTLDS